jgi:hypothetical protein
VVLPPLTVHIGTLEANVTKKQITITGYGAERDPVIALHDVIFADKDHFKNVDYPLENIAQPSNISFHYTFTIQDSLLNK